MFDRVGLNTVIKELKIDNNLPSKRTRNLAFKWACFKARGEFKDLGKLIKNSALEFKNSITPGNFFDITILSIFGSIDATICATMHAIHGIASAIFSPALIIKKDQETQPLEEEQYPFSFSNIDKLDADAHLEVSSSEESEESSSEEEEIEDQTPPMQAVVETPSSNADGYEATDGKEKQEVS